MNVTVRSTTDDESVQYRIGGYADGDAPEDSDSSEHDLAISGGSEDDEVHYEIQVDGGIEPGDRANVTKEDDVTGRVASGYTVGGTDTYRYVGRITRFEADNGATVEIDGDEVEPANVVTSDSAEWLVQDETDSARTHEIDGEVRDFEQIGGDSDWVLEVDGMPTAFGGPQSPPGGEFAFATRAQVKSFVECTIDNLELDLGSEDYVTKDQLASYAQSEEVENAIQSAFENADVSLTTSGIELTPPED